MKKPVLALALAAALTPSAFASSQAYNAFQWVQQQVDALNANATTSNVKSSVSSPGSGWSSVQPSPKNLSGWQPAGNFGVATPAGHPTIANSFRLPVKDGPIVQYAAKLTKASAAAAVVKIAMKASGPLAAGMFVYDMLKDLGLDASQNPDGSPHVTQQGSGCDISNYKPAGFTAEIVSIVELNPGNCKVNWIARAWIEPGYPNGMGGTDYIPRNANAPAEDVSWAEVERRLAEMPNWPSTDVTPSPAPGVVRALAEAIRSGEPVETQDVEPGTGNATFPYSGPILGPMKTWYSIAPATVDAPGTKTTRTEQLSCFYSPGAVACKTNTTTTTQLIDATGNPAIDPATGQPFPPVTTETGETPTPTDTQTEYCQSNPTAAGCVSLGEAPPADKLTKTTKAVSVVAEAFASGGSCPSSLGFQVMGHTYAFSYQPLCDQMVLLKTLFLVMAGVVAAFILADSFKV